MAEYSRCYASVVEPESSVAPPREQGSKLEPVESKYASDKTVSDIHQKFVEESSLEDLVYWKLVGFIDGLALENDENLKELKLLTRVTSHVERSLLMLVLKKTQGNLSTAAKVLGCNRNTLHRKLKSLDISPKEVKQQIRDAKQRRFAELDSR